VIPFHTQILTKFIPHTNYYLVPRILSLPQRERTLGTRLPKLFPLILNINKLPGLWRKGPLVMFGNVSA